MRRAVLFMWGGRWWGSGVMAGEVSVGNVIAHMASKFILGHDSGKTNLQFHPTLYPIQNSIQSRKKEIYTLTHPPRQFRSPPRSSPITP